MAGLRPAAHFYIAAIVLVALLTSAVAVSNLTALDVSSALLALAVAGLMALAYRFPLSFDVNTRLHLDTAVVFAAVLALEPGLAIAATALGTLSVNAFSLHDDDVAGWAQAAFNAAQTALHAAAGGFVLAAAGWTPNAPRFDDPRLLAVMPLAGAAMFVVNTLAVATIVALQSGGRPLRVWWASTAAMDRAETLAHLAQLGLGLLAAILADAQPWALALLLLPALVVYGGLQGHVRRRRGAEARLAAAQRIAHLGSWEWDLVADRHDWSDETFRILGHAPGAIAAGTAPLVAAVIADDRPAFMQALAQIAAGTERAIEHRICRPDGTICVVHLIGEVVRDGRGRPVRVLGTLHDITERKRLENALAHRAFHDALTDLPNRALFEERLAQALARADRLGRGVAVLFLDLDGFKEINDRFGHVAGDDLLIAVGARLRGCLRTEDTVARRGGDEFTVLLEDLREPGEAEQFAARLIAAVSSPYPLRGEEVQVGVSIGLASWWPDQPRRFGPEVLLGQADAALYAAKTAGRGRFVAAPNAWADRRPVGDLALTGSVPSSPER